MKPLKEIQQVYLAAGQVCARTSPEVVSKGLALAAGGLEVPFTRAPDVENAGFPFHMSFPLQPERPVRAAARDGAPAAPPETLCEARINALPDWTLENGTTLQICLFDRTGPAELTLAGCLALPPHDRPRVFRAALATHRARGELRLHLATPATGRTRTRSVPFDGEKLGGRARGGYQEVAFELPPAEHATELTLSLIYRGYCVTEEDNAPYLFLANPEVTSAGRGAQPVSGLSLFGTPRPGSEWYAARLPVTLSPGTPLELILGTDRATVFTPRRIAVRIAEDYGHTLMMTASEAGTFAFFIDGKPAFQATIGREPTAIRLPAAWLTGENRHLTVRDPSGMQVYLETFVLTARILTPEDVMLRESAAPFPVALSPRACHRYESLKQALARPGDAETQAQIALAAEVLEGGYENVRLRPLRFPEVATPDVSVVIPAHNKVEVTYHALCALLLARNEASFEVILVDDASTDETARIEEIVSGIAVVRTPAPQRFVRACNAGVARARGRYVVLLNNDTEPTAGWLDALIDAFGRFPRVGLAGSKLLYPDGTLQDAGGIVWETGNPWNYGNRANPWDPRFSYARQADYLSGAALMTTQAIWDEVGGLSDYLAPMYFEDTDLAFKVRAAGYGTWFVPSSVVYHFEGMTSGTDVSTGFKRYQEINRPKFKRRWARDCARFGPEGVDPDLEKDRGIVGRVLFVDYTTPRPDRDAGSYAAIQEMKLVQSLGYKVTFLPENMAHLGRYTEALQREGIEVITAPFYLSKPEFLEARGAEFDAVYITRYHVGQATIPQIRKVAPKARVIFNNADLHFLRQLRAGLAASDAERIAAAREVRGEELEVMRQSDLVLSYTEVEHAVIQSHTDGAVKVATCPWVVDIPDAVPPRAAREGLCFLGSFRHHPNTEGVAWFAREVMPQLAASHPGLGLVIYGSGMGDETRALAADNIVPAGFVEDVAVAYDRHLIFVAPLLSGAGIKGKVLSALAHGVPTVLSPIAAEGIGLRHGHDCMIAATPAEWAEAIAALEGDAALWQAVADHARSYVRERFSFARGRSLMRAAFEAVDMFGALD